MGKNTFNSDILMNCVHMGAWVGQIQAVSHTRTKKGHGAMRLEIKVSFCPPNDGLEYEFLQRLTIRLPIDDTDRVWHVWSNVMVSAGMFEQHTPWGWKLTEERLNSLIGAQVYVDVKGPRSGSILPLSRWERLRNTTYKTKRKLTPLIDEIARRMSVRGQRSLTAREMWERGKI